MSNRPAAWITFTCLILAHNSSAQEATGASSIDADVWADNWFAIYLDGDLLAEDSVQFNTERSFNADSFTFSAQLPAQVGVVMKDFKENDTGLEYIGRRGQQIGDGGFMAQFVDASNNQLLAVSDDSWKCMTIHRAPLNRSCERSDDPEQSCGADITPEPAGWKLAEFDDSEWPTAIIHSYNAVRPRGGYDDVDWQPTAKLIWSDDLEIDNTVLCRFTLAE